MYIPWPFYIRCHSVIQAFILQSYHVLRFSKMERSTVEQRIYIVKMEFPQDLVEFSHDLMTLIGHVDLRFNSNTLFLTGFRRP